MPLPLPWPFDREYMQLALVAGLVVGVAAGLFLDVWPIWTALVAALVGAGAIEWLRTRGQESGDLALAVFFYSGIAGGVVLTGLAGSLDGGILTYLFGSILTVSAADAWTIVALGAVIVVVVARTWRALFSIVLDEEAARVAGLPVDGLNLLLAGLAAVTVVAAMRVVGILLVAALMVLPVGAAQRLAASFRTTLFVAAAVGGTSAVAGLGAARSWGLAPGGTIVLVAALAYVVAAVSAGRTGRRRSRHALVAGHGPAD